ncbi:MAG: ATP-binding protein [Planctomycetes bacterium]|nr:ATP-binding protein [Planctomycetota bacterium]
MENDRERYLTPWVRADLEKKMVFLSGPRQVGKTTLANVLLAGDESRYLNWDFDADRERILARDWPAKPGLLVLDEIHKYPRWRNLVKGLHDKRKKDLSILVTGSARLDLYRRGGDSLQGRYHPYQLHPLSVAELGLRTREELDLLLAMSGFPEPWFAGNVRERKRWALEYRSRLIREDLRDLERVTEIALIERLALRLPELVGSPLSYNALREDLNVAHATVVRWCDALERLYYLFRIPPFGAPRLRALKKPPKHYHWDWALVPEPGPRLENLVASHLLKWCHYERDVNGRDLELAYFRDVDGREVDFVVLEDRKPIRFIECKTRDRGTAKGLRYLKQRFPKVEARQLTLEAGIDRQTEDGLRTTSLLDFLRELV